jgi:hypothetical protein
MSDKDLLGVKSMDDSVSFYAADKANLRSHHEAREALSRFQVPALVASGSPREKLFIAAFDDTGI